jgi:diguanylate cyclase (GGDEF)-like protein/hemerythrin-like metal-binding protein/PAS domain S-box-containing protein
MSLYDSNPNEYANQKDLMSLLFTQSLTGIFFMMLDEPVLWNESTDKEKVMDYIFDHLKITMINQAMLDQYRAEEAQMMGATPRKLFANNPELGRSVLMRLFNEGHLHADTEEQRPDGTVLTFQGDYLCLYDEQNRITGHFGMQADISDRKSAETELADNVKRLNLAIDGAEMGLWDWNLIDDSIYFSPLSKQLLGMEDNEGEGTSSGWKKLWHPDEIKMIQTAMADYLAGKTQKYELVHRLCHKDGSWRWILSRGSVLRDREGIPYRWIGTFADITRLIEERAESEALERFFSVNPDLMSITDLQGNLIKVNQAWKTILGYPPEELENRSLFDLIHPDDLGEELNKEAIEKLEKKQLINNINRYRCADGTYRYLEWHAQPAGDLVYGTARDITEKIKTEEFIEKEKELFNTTLVSVGVGIIVTDREGRILLINPMAASLTGWTGDEAFLQDVRMIFRTVNMETKELTRNPVDVVLETSCGMDSRKNAGILTKGDSAIHVAGNAAPILSGGGIDGVVITFRDITKEHMLEQEMEGFLNANLDMLCVGNRDLVIHKVNKKFTEVLGYTADEIKGKNITDILHPDDLEKIDSLRLHMRKNAVLNEVATRVQCKDGVYKYIEWNVMPGTGDYIYASARDITQKMLYEDRLRELAAKDELTGLYNRHYLDVIIGELANHADLTGIPLSFLLIDFDYFKKVNDTWGHPVGDDVLQSTASLLKHLLRDKDILVRMGGEEFAVVLPETGSLGAHVTAEKLRIAVGEHRHPTAGRQTISIGVAERMKAESFRHWYRRADEALYRAKRNGRNCVSLSEDVEAVSKSFLHIDWMSDWESGNRKIDRQHKELVAGANQFISSSLEAVDRDGVLKDLEIMISHIVKHFETEEKILGEVSYPNLIMHEQIHKELANKALKLKDELESGEVRFSAFVSFLMDEVVMDHMIKEDAKYFQYTKRRRK